MESSHGHAVREFVQIHPLCKDLSQDSRLIVAFLTESTLNLSTIVKGEFHVTPYKVYFRGYEVVVDWLRSGWE